MLRELLEDLQEAVDATGKKVLNVFSRGAPEIGIDKGPYPGTKPDMNVRKFRSTTQLKNLSFMSPEIKNITKGKRVGIGWGSSMGLYLITSAQERFLVNADRKASKEQKRHGGIPFRGSSSRVCPKCGTYCYGDCEA